MRYIAFLFIAFSIATTYSINAQQITNQKEQHKATYEANKLLIQSKTYTISPEVAYIERNRKAINSNTNFLSINGDHITSNLETLDPKVNLKLDNKVSNYKEDANDDRQVIIVEFTTSDSQFKIIVQPIGNVFIEITSSGETTTYKGKLK
ncbi:MAG: DUF4251 domain-containing protein [Winogradskyella sp.]|uniref:DUF4251 domain-containing protein n=1 Tax=Winogradskyella sp. TaxID=1883156 RepID=UPI0025CBABA6|nr:DUF4251 domain-containing protein [Winogradskyella sp.]NRB60989.1 DUF4251 domain-containing protein [Winogradskyella sp.]